MKGALSAAFGAVALLASSVLAQTELDPIVIKGSKFFFKTNGTQFYMRGVAYQQEVGTNGTIGDDDSSDYSDPLADPAGCRRDIPLLQELRTNIIRVYAIDPEQDHSECMGMLADAGIYLIADLSQPKESINRDDPSWDDDLYTRYTSVVDSLANYTNVLGFFAGNEVPNQPNNTASSAFVKAAVRDTKAYIRQQGYREMGVGYATNDDAEIRENLADYFNCGTEDDSIDFWGYNIYSWCGDSSFSGSGYEDRTDEFESYSVPVFFAEYGCNEVQPREFTDVPVLYGPQMNDVWSGGIIYMYFQEENDFGLVRVDGDDVEKLDDFDNLSSQLADIDPTGVNMDDYNPTNTQLAACPTVDSDWGAASSPLPPQPNPELCQCMMRSLSCTVDSSVDEEDYGDLFGFVCGANEDYCAGIAHNGTTAEYGAYSMCNATEQLAFVFNQYASDQGGNSDACSFDGAGATQDAEDPSGTCEELMDQAGAAGTGTVTSAPTNGGSAPGATSSGASSALTIPTFNAGFLYIALYAFGAVFVGAGMIFL
ncbi:Glucanosyltransferase-domain-containing protein [Lineolata rhizophorae]|uniref:1,3-beta-glucanosyltransferase n=1 Tax=Lineolata rhizophorae TaxID=578093 RepID=A0A6A6P6Y7_9PEZI|nr:Glucanosyltransferase-domain-containing protein [Lineolata rhizophorae]